MGSVKIEKLAQRIKERTGEVLLREMNDPRFGFVTVTKVKLARDLRHCTVFYSVLGNDAEKSKIASALDHARGFIQRKVAEVLHTRTTPILEFRYDQSVEGSVRVSRLIDEVAREWKSTESESGPDLAEEEGKPEADRDPVEGEDPEPPARDGL
jgi:ribosome-binding factor A